jgi:hypothetical protein
MFVEINGIIVDKKEHNRKVLLFKRLLQYEFLEIVRKYDFKKKEGFFVHEETGIRVKLVFEEIEQKPL